MQVNWGTAPEPGWQVLEVAGADPAGLAAARRWAEDKLASLAEADRVDVVIVVGELLENAYVHATGPSQLRIHLGRDPCEVTVAVADVGTGEPRLRVPGRSGGRGLLLVDELALAWGVSHHDDGKIVWARLACQD
ncbi:ATP-binding protein [Amycolatopsis sp. A133]|uniref:ATP-binding protein n=1 Tax=Amycolatopsis sp. A133 TaxID=3064472 RepID=UPI0027F6C10D|nr:ATP-binding protein [Amycolatopsis sp. A133]MDQ7808916.1 ATP-binding protein [Amycolatopsis sp. A133]